MDAACGAVLHVQVLPLKWITSTSLLDIKVGWIWDRNVRAVQLPVALTVAAGLKITPGLMAIVLGRSIL